ncbi:hypothetical protein Poly59_60120 [Rubripirellula reticaptiva]|uniref:Uncharacterized protein n=1 Tax=Rubripirellula reticaptiva TaxID=2528013 RepID=A0A5C6EDY0_9BACT|nr:hypothetical protein Poly59_60120 [Rubripirellula reticaptiva]
MKPASEPSLLTHSDFTEREIDRHPLGVGRRRTLEPLNPLLLASQCEEQISHHNVDIGNIRMRCKRLQMIQRRSNVTCGE